MVCAGAASRRAFDQSASPPRRGEGAGQKQEEDMIAAQGNAASQKFASDRLTALGKGDVAALVAQYQDDAVVITPRGTLRGPVEIRGMIEGIIAEFARPGVKFDLISQSAEGPIAAFMWTADTATNVYDLGAETYVLKAGKVAYQTFAAKVSPK
jgi:ketosteroid isomerase-like protein